MAQMIKVVKVPVMIADQNVTIKEIKRRALEQEMREARFLANLAIRSAIAFSLKGTPKEYDEAGKEVPLDTRVYRILSKERNRVPSEVASALSRNFAVKLFRSSNRDAWTGKKSLPTYRSLFIPFPSRRTKISQIEEQGSKQFMIEPSGFKWAWLPDDFVVELSGDSNLKLEKEQKRLKLVSCFSWKDKGALEIVGRIEEGRYELRDSQIKSGPKGLMLYLACRFETAPPELDPRRVCGIDLGVVIPVTCAVNFGPQRLYLGSGDVIWAARSKYRAIRRRKQRQMGLDSKTRQWERSEAEKNWIHTYYHALTRQVIRFCIQNGCGTIHIENLTSLREIEVQSEYKRLLWVPITFLELLAYKAREARIEVIEINPRNSSRHCPECGHTSKMNRRTRDEFVCEECGDPAHPIHADYIGARVIALADERVIAHGYA